MDTTSGLSPQQAALVAALAGQTPQAQTVAGGVPTGNGKTSGVVVPPSAGAAASSVLQKVLAAYMGNKMMNQNQNNVPTPQEDAQTNAYATANGFQAPNQ